MAVRVGDRAGAFAARGQIGDRHTAQRETGPNIGDRAQAVVLAPGDVVTGKGTTLVLGAKITGTIRVAISGATASTNKLASSALGGVITVKVTGSRSGYCPEGVCGHDQGDGGSYSRYADDQ